MIVAEHHHLLDICQQVVFDLQTGGSIPEAVGRLQDVLVHYTDQPQPKDLLAPDELDKYIIADTYDSEKNFVPGGSYGKV